MVELTGTRVVIDREPVIPNKGETRKTKCDCSNCKHEGKDYLCYHPKEGTKAFKKMEMSQCWEGKYIDLSFSQKASRLSKNRKRPQC